MMQEYVICEKEDLVAMADAVREATGDTEKYNVPELKNALINSYRNINCVKTVNGIAPDENGNVTVSAMPNDVEQLDMLIEADMLPSIHYNGAIITDENGRIILRY